MKKFVFAVALATLIGSLPVTAAYAATPSWPNVTQQLSRDRVVPGSPLEHLIRDNQDFQKLHKAELTDTLGIPPWLRVYWRKAHPDFVYSAADPTGGYPRVINEIHEWMLAHQDLVPGLPDPDVKPPLVKTIIGSNLRISGAQIKPRSESDIRMNYWNTLKIIAASNNITAGGHQGQYYSTDGGLTWGQTTLPFTGTDTFHSDPTVDWTSDGTAWSTTIGIDAGSNLRMRSYKSIDNGVTWTFDNTFSTGVDNDKQMIWVDHSATSIHPNYLYAIWHNGAPVYMNRRTGPAGVWGAPILVSGAETTGTGIGGDVKTNSFGDAFGAWPDTGSQGIYIVKSTDGGATYSAPTLVATTYNAYDIGVPSFNSRRALIYVTLGAYRKGGLLPKNEVYATWTDLSGAAGCNSDAFEPGASVASNCKTRIWFARSTNGGTTWSAPIMTNNQAGKNDQYNQWMVVDETNGAIGLIYYDTVADAGRKKTDVWYQTSFDGGVTWAAALKVTTAMTDETIAGADAGNQYGDYNSLSAYSRVLFPSWTDRRSLAKEEIWTAKIQEPKTDVWIKDKPWDTGAEPDPATAANNMWESEDIWVRNDPSAGPHQNPEFGQPNYIHATVRNRSTTVDGINVPVEFYWANASAGLVWPTNWHYIATGYTVPSTIPAVSTATAEATVVWSPAGTGHYCLIARIATAQDPMTNTETSDVNYNTRYNNNIAWKNVNVVNLVAIHVVPVRVLVHNILPEPRVLNLRVRERPVAGQERKEPFITRARLTVDLGADLGKRWQASGGRGAGIRALDEKTIEITDPTQAYIAVPFGPDEEFDIGLTFEDMGKPVQTADKSVSYEIEIVQEDAEKGGLQGGVVYQIEALPVE
jgi:hypothetical protein